MKLADTRGAWVHKSFVTVISCVVNSVILTVVLDYTVMTCAFLVFIFEDDGKLYLYVTAKEGVEAYSSDTLLGTWHYEGIIGALGEGEDHYWAPSVIKYEGKYYVYTSFIKGEEFEYMYVASADSPLGPFTNWKKLYDYFSIDSHIVQTEAGLFLWSAMDNHAGNTPGTRVFIDRMIDPYTPEGTPREMIVPSFREEIFKENRHGALIPLAHSKPPTVKRQ